MFSKLMRGPAELSFVLAYYRGYSTSITIHGPPCIKAYCLAFYSVCMTTHCLQLEWHNNLIFIAPLNSDAGLDPPDSLKLVNIRGGQAVLEWSPVVSTCPQDIIYNISSNCSSCSSRLTNSTTTSCPIPQPNATTGDTICTFSIQSVVCEVFGGERSHPLEVVIPGKWEL